MLKSCFFEVSSQLLHAIGERTSWDAEFTGNLGEEREPFIEPVKQASLVIDVCAAIAALPAEERAVCAALANGESIAGIARQLGRSWHAANKILGRIREHFEVLGLDAWIRG